MSTTLKELRKTGTVEIHASGKLHKSDYDEFVPQLEQAIEKHGKVSIIFVMHDFHGWDIRALLEDIKFDGKHFNDLERVAFVGDRDWERWMVNFCRPFTNAEIQYFPSDQEDDARQWLLKDVGLSVKK